LGVLFVSYEKSCEKKRTYGYYKEQKGEEEEVTEAASEGCITNLEVLAEQTQETEEVEKRAFLTFDDGPSEVTETILKILDEQGIKATFFLIGEQITEDKEELVKRMSEEGHEIGVHTYTHEKNQIYASAQAYVEDVEKTAERIEEVTGKKPVYYRFPWGSVNKFICSYRTEVIEELANRGYQYVDWNVSGEDSVGSPSIQTIYGNIKKDYDKYREPVVLMHDSGTNQLTAETLPDVIKLFQEAGYGFGKMGERSCAYQWGKQ
jgi:peptidoglycan/xylan/chitin deacetylase (PgdA/CDA1 family)